jgi:hypothetical protein
MIVEEFAFPKPATTRPVFEEPEQASQTADPRPAEKVFVSVDVEVSRNLGTSVSTVEIAKSATAVTAFRVEIQSALEKPPSNKSWMRFLSAPDSVIE